MMLEYMLGQAVAIARDVAIGGSGVDAMVVAFEGEGPAMVLFGIPAAGVRSCRAQLDGAAGLLCDGSFLGRLARGAGRLMLRQGKGRGVEGRLGKLMTSADKSRWPFLRAPRYSRNSPRMSD